jgi:hypothetical protein
MSCRKAWWLAVAVVFALLAAGAALGEDGKTVREVAIPGTGLALRVPANVVVSRDAPASPHAATLSLEVQSISSFPRNGVITRAEVLAQRAALAKGQAKVADAWSEDGLAETVPLPTGGYAAIYPQYSEFEVCDVRFSLNAAFFVGDQRVILRYSAPPAGIIKENPAFFGRDKANCGNDTVWKHTDPGILKRFHVAAKAGRLGPAANAWQADFAAILASLHKQRAPQ